MDRPAQSPVVNPIEHFWNQIKTMVQEQNPASVKELWTDINSAWEGFQSDKLNNLIVTMFRRCAALIMTRGGPTKYLKLWLLYLFCGFGIMIG